MYSKKKKEWIKVTWVKKMYMGGMLKINALISPHSDSYMPWTTVLHSTLLGLYNV